MNKTNRSCVGSSTSGGRFPRARAELTRTGVRVEFGTSLSRRSRRLPLRILKPAACSQQAKAGLVFLSPLSDTDDAPDRAGHETPVGPARAEDPGLSEAREAAEAEPTESEVASPVGLIHLYSFKLDFVYSLKSRPLGRL